MANWNTLKGAVANVINANGNQAITGQLLQNVLNNIITNVGENATFAGIATVDTNPGAPDGPVFYLATTAGVYSNFNGIEVQDGEAVILLWNNNAWSKKVIVTGFATQEKLSQLGSELRKSINNEVLRAKEAEEELENNIHANRYGYNVTVNGLKGGVHSIETAIKYVPVKFRMLGQKITFRTENGDWATYHNESLSLDNYENVNDWVQEVGISSVQGDVIITNAPDYEDLTEAADGTIKFADKEYSKDSFSGLGRVYLRKNIVDGVNVLTQDMMPKSNTIYIIQYDYDLQGAEITIPEGCILDFQGGSFNNIGNLKGNINNNYLRPEWFGAKGKRGYDDTNAIQQCINLLNSSDNHICTVLLSGKCYYVNGIELKPYVNIKGDGIGQTIINGSEGNSSSVITIPITGVINQISDLSISGNYNKNGIYIISPSSGEKHHVFNSFIEFGIKNPTNGANLKYTTLENISIANCNKGINAEGSSALGLFRFSKIVSYKCNIGIAGTYIDGEFDNVEISWANKYAISVNAGNVRFQNFKLWFNGGSKTYIGDELVDVEVLDSYYTFELKGSRNILSDIEIQDSFSNGLYVLGSNNLFSNIILDDNGFSSQEDIRFYDVVLDWGSNNNIFSNIQFTNYRTGGSYTCKVLDNILNRGDNNLFHNTNFGISLTNKNYTLSSNISITQKGFICKENGTPINTIKNGILNENNVYIQTDNNIIEFKKKSYSKTFMWEFIHSSYNEATILAFNDIYKFGLKQQDGYLALMYSYSYDKLIENIIDLNKLSSGTSYRLYISTNILNTKLYVSIYKVEGNRLYLVGHKEITKSGTFDYPKIIYNLFIDNICKITKIGTFEGYVKANHLAYSCCEADNLLYIDASQYNAVYNYYGINYNNNTLLKTAPVPTEVKDKELFLICNLDDIEPVISNIEIISQHYNSVSIYSSILTITKYNNNIRFYLTSTNSRIYKDNDNNIYVKANTWSLLIIKDLLTGLYIKPKLSDKNIEELTLIPVDNYSAINGSIPALKYGFSVDRPSNINPGFSFFDRQQKKAIWWNGESWVDSSDNDANANYSGIYKYKPDSPRIGFQYFCTDRKTAEGATDGIMIYHKGNNVWVDALGRVVE